MKKVSVVIPVYNGWDLLKRNIETLLRYDADNIAEIIVVNDCSPIRNPFDFDSLSVTIIENKRNLGYTGTVNNGLKKAKCDIILLLDSDAFLFCPIVNQLVEIFNKDKSIGCVGFSAKGELGNPTGSYQYPSSVLGFIIGQVMQVRLRSIIAVNKKEILPLSCCVSFRKQCLEELNYFDEKTFPVLEADTDLGMRIHRSRWRLLYNEKIAVIHEGGHSYKVDSKRVRMYHRANWQLFEKHNMLTSPRLVRQLLSLRIRLEITVLYLLQLRNGGKNVREKLEGRKLLLKEVQHY